MSQFSEIEEFKIVERIPDNPCARDFGCVECEDRTSCEFACDGCEVKGRCETWAQPGSCEFLDDVARAS